MVCMPHLGLRVDPTDLPLSHVHLCGLMIWTSPGTIKGVCNPEPYQDAHSQQILPPSHQSARHTHDSVRRMPCPLAPDYAWSKARRLR